MNEPHASQHIWQQVMADMTTRLGRVLMAECQSWHILRQHLLRAQAEVLKGLLEVVESRLEPVGRDNPPAGEKIPVD
jgi:hypothetical protein